jgi:hypothetical protein
MATAEGAIPEGAVDQLELGLVTRIIDEASEPAEKVAAGVQNLVNWFGRLIDQAKEAAGVDDFSALLRGDEDAIRRFRARTSEVVDRFKNIGAAIRDRLRTPLENIRRLGERVWNPFTRRLAQVGALIGGFFAIRALKRSFDELFESTVRLEEAFISLANLTGSEEFAADLVDWARDLTDTLPATRDQILQVGTAFARVGVDVRDIDIAGLFEAARVAGEDFVGFSTRFAQASRDPASFMSFLEGLDRVPVSMQALAASFNRFDIQGRAAAVSGAMGEFFDGTLERTRTTVTSIRTFMASMLDEIRQSVIGVPGRPGLFETIRSGMEGVLDFMRRNRPIFEQIGATIGSFLEIAARTVRDMFETVVRRLDPTIETLGDRMTFFQERVFGPLLVVAEAVSRALVNLTGTIVDAAKDLFSGEGPVRGLLREAANLVGFGLIAMGIMFRRPGLLISGALMVLPGLIGEEAFRNLAEGAFGDREEGDLTFLDDLSGKLQRIQELSAAAGIAMIGFGIATGNIPMILAGAALAAPWVVGAITSLIDAVGEAGESLEARGEFIESVEAGVSLGPGGAASGAFVGGVLETVLPKRATAEEREAIIAEALARPAAPSQFPTAPAGVPQNINIFQLDPLADPVVQASQIREILNLQEAESRVP